MKSFRFVSEAAREDYLALPRKVRRKFGTVLRQVQAGEPTHCIKDVSMAVGAGAAEVVQNGSPAYRAIFCSKFSDAVCVLHAFTKTAQGVDRTNLARARKRYKAMRSSGLASQ